MDNKALSEIVKTEVSKLTAAVNKLVLRIGSQLSKKDENANRHEDDAGRNDGYIKLANPVRMVVNPPPSSPEAQKPQNPWYKSPDKLKTLLEVIAIPFAIAYAVVTYKQWQDLRKNFSIDERAWIQFKIKGEPNKSLSEIKYPAIPVSMVNFGKTAAKKVLVITNAEVLSREAAPSFTYTLTRDTVDGIVFPNDPVDVLVEGPKPLTEDQRQRLITGEAYIAAYATVTWEDVFGESHWLHFCARHVFTDGFSNAKSCADYNDTDGN